MSGPETDMDQAWLYLDVANVMIVALNREGVVTMINPAGCRVLGGDREQIVGEDWFDTFIPESIREEMREGYFYLMEHSDTVPTDVFEEGYVNPVKALSGEERIVSWHNAWLRDEAGDPTGVLSSGQDITERERERRAMEAQIRQQQRLDSIGTLASGVAHEINNPINGIMNYAQLIADAHDPNHTTASYAREIIHETERVATIVRDLLTFARQESGHRQPVAIPDAVAHTESLVRAIMRRDRIRFEIHIPENLPSVMCHSQQIQQVLMNLLTNARDAVNARHGNRTEHKRIIVTATSLDKAGEPWVRVTVADRGEGIAEEVRDRLFDPFFTTKPKDVGTGLGLSISHGIVQSHGGELHFETGDGPWTRFHVDLPCNGADATDEA